MPERNRFNADVAAVAEDAKQSVTQLIAELKTLTPTELLRVPRNVINQLSHRQYVGVIGAVAPFIAPNQLLPRQGHDNPIGPLKAKRKPWSAAKWWGATGPFYRAALITLAISVAIPIFTTLAWPSLKMRIDQARLVRTVDASIWPSCNRLDTYVDGCVYRNRTPLRWEIATRYLRIDAEQLRVLNSHITYPTPIPANSSLIVWRGRGRLMEYRR